MIMLEAAMAFAIAMIIFSTVATSIVEVIHRVAGTRQKQLERMIKYLFQNIVWPRISRNLERRPTETQEQAMHRHCKEFIEALTMNPMGSARGEKALLGYEKKLDKFIGTKIESLTSLAFAERLGRTEVGKAILTEGEQQLELLITDFTRSLERLSRTATEFLDSRARALAMGVGIVLALTVNIDASRLMSTLIETPELRTSLIEQADTVVEENQQAAQKLLEVAEKAKAGKLDEDQITKIEEASTAIQKKVQSLESAELPIGYAYFPYCGNSTDQSCKDTDISHYFRWFFMCLLSGMLIGLGGPFWYRVFSVFSQIVQMMRALGIGRKPEEKDKGEVSTIPAPEDSAKPKSVIDAFKVAASVHWYSPPTPDAASQGREPG